MRGLYKSRGRADHRVHQDKWPYCMRSLLSCICTELTLLQPLSDLLCFTDCCASYLYDAPWWMEFWHDYRRLNTELAGVTRWLMTEGLTLTVFLLLPSNGEKSPSLSWWPSIARPLRHEIQAVGPILMRKMARILFFPAIESISARTWSLTNGLEHSLIFFIGNMFINHVTWSSKI